MPFPWAASAIIEGETAELRVFYANASGTEHYLARSRSPLSDIDTLLSQLIERLQHITTA